MNKAIEHKGDFSLVHDSIGLGSCEIIARTATLQTQPVHGMPNLRRRIQREYRNCTKPVKTDDVADCIRFSGKLDSGGSWTMEFELHPDALRFSLHIPNADEIGFSFTSPSDEAFWGFGEQFSHLNMAGKSFTLCTSEQGIGRGAQPISTLVNLGGGRGASGNAFTTYAPMPVFVTSQGRAMCFEQDSIYWCDIRKSKRDRVQITAWGDTLSGWVFGGNSPLELIERHTAITGRLPKLPEFAFGSILGIRGGRAAAEEILQKCRDHGAPVTALWIEDWQGKRGKNGGPPLWWRWYPDETLYPDFKNWVKSLHDKGIAVLGYANPMLSAHADNRLYLEGREKRYFVQNADGSDWTMQFYTGKEFQSVLVDLTNPAAYAWLKERMREGMVETGLSGWMADYGEYVPLNCRTYNGDAVAAHAAHPVLWAKLNRELIEETGNLGKILAFHRSAGAGSNQYAACYWAGDQNPTFDAYDGLASSIVGLISGGISGMSVNHTDIGGYTTLITPIYKLTRKKEVMLRWLEYAAFTPLFRTHDASVSSPHNYQFYYDEAGYEAFAKFGRVHFALKWYLQELQEEAVTRGYPMVRALCLHYPDDVNCFDIRHQYLLGSDLLVTPVWRSKAREVTAYLPHGDWRCIHTGKRYLGGVHQKLPAPLGKPAVLIRAESHRAERLYSTLQDAFA